VATRMMTIGIAAIINHFLFRPVIPDGIVLDATGYTVLVDDDGCAGGT